MTVARLAEVARINPRPERRPSLGEIVSFVPMAELDARTAATTRGTDRPFQEVQKGYTIFSDGDLLVAKITPCFQNNKIGQAQLRHPVGVGSTEFHVIRPLIDRLDARYALHFLRQRHVLLDGERRMTGSGGQRRVPADFLADLEVPLPPLEEQRMIAAILDQADALRAKRREALAHLDDLTQSIFLDMFGDRRSLLTAWPTKPLGDLLEFLTSGSRGWAKHYVDDGDLFLRIQNVRRDELVLEDVAFVRAPATAEAQRTQVREDDVLLSITADLGRTAVVPPGLGRAFINQHLSILRVPSVVPRFLSAYLSSDTGQGHVLGRNRQAVKAGLNFDDIRSFIIPLPPRDFQQTFADRARRVQTQARSQLQSLHGLNSLFVSLQDHAFARGL